MIFQNQICVFKKVNLNVFEQLFIQNAQWLVTELPIIRCALKTLENNVCFSDVSVNFSFMPKILNGLLDIRVDI